MSKKMNFQEIVNVNNAKYLLNLPDSYWSKNIFNNEEQDQDGHKYTEEQYIINCRQWLKLVIRNKGNLKSEYKFSKCMIDNGRIYVKKFGIQSLQRDLRGFLSGEFYVDLDMKNAHNQILLFLRNKFFKHVKVDNLENYINNRDNILSNFKLDKVDILKILNCEWKYSGTNKFLKALDFEFKTLQNEIWNSKEFEEVSKSSLKVKNKKGSFTNRVLCVYENIILQEAIKKIGCDVPMFDGFFLRKTKNIDINKIIEMLNDNIYGITWTNKPHSNKIKIDESLVIKEYEQDLNDYENKKIEFEKNFFMLKNPVLFFEELDNKLLSYKKADFQTIVAPWKYEEHGKQKNFFNKWIEDQERRTYEKTDFIPRLDNIPEGTYNLFKPFKSQYLEKDERVDTKLFFELIDLLVDYREEPKQYLISYISDIFQNTDKCPHTGILFKGCEGAGKNMMFEFINQMMGNDYYREFDDLDQVIGKFNSGITKKILISLAELDGLDASKFDNKIKSFVTSEEHRIERKGIDPIIESNFKRIFASSNGDIPLKLSTKNRRWSVFTTAAPREKEFYQELGTKLKSQIYLNSLYSELMDFKIEMDITKPILTSEILEMEVVNINPFYIFCYEFLVKKEILLNTAFNYNESEDEKIFLRNDHLKVIFSDWIETNDEYGEAYLQKINFRKFKLLFQKIGIEQKTKKINQKAYRGYDINLNMDFQKLKVCYDWDKYAVAEIE